MREIDHAQTIETSTCHECIDRGAKDGKGGDGSKIAKEIAFMQMITLFEDNRWKKEHKK